MTTLVCLFLISIIAAWLLWHYRKVHKLPIVRFGARAGSILLWIYAVLLLVAMFNARDWMAMRLSREIVPVWAAAPIVWGVWGGWTWLHVGDWIFGRRGRG